MTDLTQTQPDKLPIVLNVTDHGCDWAAGDILMNDSGSTAHVTGVYQTPKGIVVAYRYRNNNHETLTSLDEIKRNRYVKLHCSIDELEQEALKALADPAYLDSLDLFGGGTGSNEQSTAVTTTATAEQLQAIHNSALKLKERAYLLEIAIKRMIDPIRAMQEIMRKRLNFVSNALDMLQAYAGIYEEIVLLRDGQPCADPLSIRQAVLFMDEEAAITDYDVDGFDGIDFRSIGRFDQWILADPRHLDQVLPERKGVVAIKPSRQIRPRGDWWLQMAEDRANNLTYFLIRNGERVYRVATGFSLGSLLYPLAGEYAGIMEQVAKERGGKAEDYKWQGVALGWRRNIALLQGLIERTDIFQPMPAINLFEPQNEGSPLRLISDGEPSLTDGRPTFAEWRRAINGQVEVGDRFYLTIIDISRYDEARRSTDRFSREYTDPPRFPEPGVYNIERVVKDQRHGYKYLEFLYLPNDDIWRYPNGYEKRTRRESFKLYYHDWFWIGYANVTLEDVDYYINLRTERHNYLKIIPLLKRIRDELRTEQAYESAMITALTARLGVTEDHVKRGIDWWKNKARQKRPIKQDDAKAWRMIERHIKAAHNSSLAAIGNQAEYDLTIDLEIF